MENLGKLRDFNKIQISIASPEDVENWSYGKILKPETINYRTFKPERDGLMDERIFGPVKDYECACGKHKGARYRGVICDKCGVEVTHSKVRRERMGHIDLAASVAHVWFFRGIPSKMAILLDMSPRNLEAVIYFSSFIVINVDNEKKAKAISEINETIEKTKVDTASDLELQISEILKSAEEQTKLIEETDEKKKEKAIAKIEKSSNKEIAKAREVSFDSEQDKIKELQKDVKKVEQVKKFTIMSDNEYIQLEDYLEQFAEVSIGAEAIEKILSAIDIPAMIDKLREDLTTAKGMKIKKITKRLSIVEGIRRSKVKPEWMILNQLPVIPPDLRPMVQLEGGRFATSDLNDLYRRVINRNNRLRKLLDLGAPEIIVRNEKRMLQEAVDSLLDSSRSRRQRTTRGRKELRSLADMLKGKQGRFRANLLGKRVDYSGRSVIVVGPDLKLNECGLPREMALELFKPFVLKQILSRGLAPNVKTAKFMLDERSDEVYDILEDVVKGRPVLLNRAPTLHKLGIQAFIPRLIDGNAIQLHPCACPGYNADFDGDQMAVHIPLSKAAVKEALEVMISTKNIRKPSTGVPIAIPDREMLLGLYYLTSIEEKVAKSELKFSSPEDAYYSFLQERISLRQPVDIKIKGEYIETTVGRCIFNQVLPESLGFFNEPANKKNDAARQLIEKTIQTDGEDVAVKLIDDLKTLGFRYATFSGTSMSIADVIMPKGRDAVLTASDNKVKQIDQNFQMGLITNAEKARLSQTVWIEATNELSDLVWSELGKENSIRTLVESGARGNIDQVKQMGGMVGLKADPTGKIVDLPLKGNYKIGLSTFEYFNSARGARKGFADGALRTADAGYLTRRLVDVSQDVIVRTVDCGTKVGITVRREDEVLLASIKDRLKGRISVKDVKVGKEILVKAGDIMTEDIAIQIEKSGVTEVEVRSPMTCITNYGICAKCYGTDLNHGQLVALGTPVGVIAAQSIGEPGTQLTMRTRHTGGIVTTNDITQGLPRVEEVFEARSPRSSAVMAEHAGKVSVKIDTKTEERIITLQPTDDDIEPIKYSVDPVAEIKVSDKDLVTAGQPLTEGYLDLQNLMVTVGVKETQRYIVNQIQKVYSSQGVSLSDKHIEVIVKQMFNYLIIEETGDTDFLPGELVSRSVFSDENKKVLAQGGDPATGQVTLLGVTRSSLATESWLSAASFMETSRVLTEAAIEGKIDPLIGLKENVIIGRMIPVGVRARIEEQKEV
jgi:DNA-directed RNA polymerase subunit beta'